jgi:hypothetical protein
MVDAFTFAELIDVGFIAFVALSCWYALTHSDNSAGENTGNWKAELEELRRSLQGLISEASVASHNLDRNLQRREDELHSLLKQLQSLKDDLPENIVAAAAAAPARQPAPTPELITEQAETKDLAVDDMPNASWFEPPENQVGQDTTAVGLPTKETSVRQKLEDAIEIRKTKDFAKPVIDGNSDTRELSIRRPSSIDPMAYKVAQRLLKRGQPIHLVARKLELTTSEVREIYKIIFPDSDSIEQENIEASDSTSFIELDEAVENPSPLDPEDIITATTNRQF